MEEIISKINDVLSYNEDKLYKVELEGYGDMSLKQGEIDGKHAKNFFRLNSLNLLPFLEKIANHDKQLSATQLSIMGD